VADSSGVVQVFGIKKRNVQASATFSIFVFIFIIFLEGGRGCMLFMCYISCIIFKFILMVLLNMHLVLTFIAVWLNLLHRFSDSYGYIQPNYCQHSLLSVSSIINSTERLEFITH